MHDATSNTNRQVGLRVKRIEDPRLLTGRGCFIDDLSLPGMLEAAVLRSPLAHALILSIDTQEAEAMDGVHAVLTGAELERLVQPQPVIYHLAEDQVKTNALAMATDRVRWVGQPVAAVVATDRFVAEDAIQTIFVDYEELASASSLEDAIAPDGPLLYDDIPGNVAATTRNIKGDVDTAFAEADVVVAEHFRLGRMLGCPLEPRGCVASWDPMCDELDIWLSTQAPHLARDLFGEVLNLPLHKIRVRVPDVGGGFGVKFDFFGEEIIASVLSRRVGGRPVKLVEDRLEAFTASGHAREVSVEASIALRTDGTILGVRGHVHGVLGGALATVGIGPPHGCAAHMLQGYRVPNADIRFTGVLTNRAPVTSFRGWGQPEGNFIIERLVHLAARELELEPSELRRRNLPAPDEFPYDTGIVYTFDSGRYADCVDLADATVRELNWPNLCEHARSEGRSVGIGTAFFVEGTAFGPSRALNRHGLRAAGFDTEMIRMDASGRITVHSGMNAMGQGVQTALAQVAAEAMGVPLDYVNVLAGEGSDSPFTGYGTGGSRGAAVGGGTLSVAAKKLRDKVERVAAFQLEADPADLVIEAGEIFVRGAPQRRLTMAQIGDAAHRRLDGLFPEGEEPSLEASHVFDPENQAWAYGAVAMLVEVDRETGVTDVLGCVFAHDCGTIINPMIVDGQIHGGVAQSIGQALYEDVVYDQDGQVRSATFADYLIPTASEIPRFTIREQHTPSPLIPGGMKGIGEAGVIPILAGVANAIDDALGDIGVRVTRLPATPPRLLDLIDAAQASRSAVS